MLMTCAVVLVLSGQVAAAPPDLSGEWVVAETASPESAPRAALALTGIFGERFLARQTTKTLTLELSVSTLPRSVHVVYALDGTESKNMNPLPGGAEEPIYSTAKWDGGRLVIDTRGATLVNGKPQTSRRILTLNPDGTLMIERTAPGQSVVRSLYKRARE